MKAKYYIYKNLHKNCYSIKYKGKVIEHADYIYVENAEFKVNEKGRQRAIKTRQRNVHAYIVADSYTSDMGKDGELIEKIFEHGYHTAISYNPFKRGFFDRGYDYDNNLIPIYKAKKILVIWPHPLLIEL
jgi:hypothetical protein